MFQTKSILGNWRNCIAVVVMFNEKDKDRIKLQNAHDLRKIKYVSLGLGKGSLPKPRWTRRAENVLATYLGVASALSARREMHETVTTGPRCIKI